MLTFEGAQFLGVGAIVEKLTVTIRFSRPSISADHSTVIGFQPRSTQRVDYRRPALYI
jgi:hypothetical protein